MGQEAGSHRGAVNDALCDHGLFRKLFHAATSRRVVVNTHKLLVRCERTIFTLSHNRDEQVRDETSVLVHSN